MVQHATAGMDSWTLGYAVSSALYFHQQRRQIFRRARAKRVILPPPTVDVTPRETDSGHEIDVVISRDGKGKSYTGGGPGFSPAGATRHVIEKILSDPLTGEWLP